MRDVQAVTKIANCLGVSPGLIELNEDKVVTRKNEKNKTVTGFATILCGLARESDSEIARNSFASRETDAEVYQWVEFAVLYVHAGSKDKHISQQILRDFNKLFSKKSYLVGHSITLADLAIFYSIYDLVKTLSPIDKEKYLNFSRWFDHMQHRPEVRQNGGELLNFSTIYLHGWVTGTHV